MRHKITLPKGVKLIAVGDIHEHEEQVDKLLAEVKPGPFVRLVLVGDIYDKGFGKDVAESITNKIIPLVESGYAYVIKGNHELSSIRWARVNKTMTEQLRWWDKQPLSLTFTFSNRTKVTVVHGGVLPSYTEEDLAYNVDTCYIRLVDKRGKKVKRLKKIIGDRRVMVMERPGKAWHKLYDGRFGYIVSGHASRKDGIPKFYDHSCNLDTAVYHTGKLTAQVFEEGIRKELLTFVGTPKYPDLLEMERLMLKGRI